MDTRITHRLGAAALLAGAALLGGCAHTTPEWDSRFGQSVRVMTAAQVLDPAAVRNTDPPAGLDGRAARAAQERYERSLNPPAAPQPALINGGGAK